VWCAMSATRIILCICVCVSINYTYSDTVFEDTPITGQPVLLFSNTMLQLTQPTIAVLFRESFGDRKIAEGFGLPFRQV
jgi:hypothetical protein